MRAHKVRWAIILGSLLIAAAPVFAHGQGGGGHGGGSAAGGGGHVSAAHSGGTPHAGFGSNGSGATHFAAANTYAGGGSRAYGAQHAYAGQRGYSGVNHSYAAYSGATASRGTLAGRNAYGYRGSYAGYHGGYSGYTGGYRGYHGYSTGAYWGGGWWHGGYWPRCYYGVGFAWFLPVLPLTYATYWYAGIPYYYANSVYYTWAPSYEGYVVTDPPPVADQSGSATDPASQAIPADSGYPDANSQGGAIFMYPANGQSPQQQAIDKRECEKWASDQVGPGTNGPDYRRAMMACAQARGYSTS